MSYKENILGIYEILCQAGFQDIQQLDGNECDKLLDFNKINSFFGVDTPPKIVGDPEFISNNAKMIFSGTRYFKQHVAKLVSQEFRKKRIDDNHPDAYWFTEDLSHSLDYAGDGRVKNVIIAKPSTIFKLADYDLGETRHVADKMYSVARGPHFAKDSDALYIEYTEGMTIQQYNDYKIKEHAVVKLLSNIPSNKGRHAYSFFLYGYDGFKREIGTIGMVEKIVFRRKNLIIPKIPQAAQFVDYCSRAKNHYVVRM